MLSLIQRACASRMVLAGASELCVGDTAALLGLPIKLVSHHVRSLAERGLATKQRDGKLIRYQLTEEARRCSRRRSAALFRFRSTWLTTLTSRRHGERRLLGRRRGSKNSFPDGLRGLVGAGHRLRRLGRRSGLGTA